MLNPYFHKNFPVTIHHPAPLPSTLCEPYPADIGIRPPKEAISSYELMVKHFGGLKVKIEHKLICIS